MKLSKTWLYALFALASVNQHLAWAQDEEAAADPEAGADDAAADTPEGDAAADENAEENAEDAEAEADEPEIDPYNHDPLGPEKLGDYQLIFRQAATNWQGFQIPPFFTPAGSTGGSSSSAEVAETEDTAPAEDDAAGDDSGSLRFLQDETAEAPAEEEVVEEEEQPAEGPIAQEEEVDYVGRVDGQTGWTGVNQDGNKIMSYQFSIIVRANEGKTLSDIFAVNRAAGQATQFGWWIPYRDEEDPPEKWTMNLADVYLKTDVTGSHLEMRQTIWNAGLYDQPESSVDGYKVDERFDTQRNVSNWYFSRDLGTLQSWDETDDSLMPTDQYFIPVPELCSISDEMLVITLEGSSLKQDLPEIKQGNTQTVWF